MGKVLRITEISTEKDLFRVYSIKLLKGVRNPVDFLFTSFVKKVKFFLFFIEIRVVSLLCINDVF